MLILAKSTMAMMLGFVLSIIIGFFLIPILKSLKLKQKVSLTIGERHMAKDGTPTMGGFIFIIPTLISLLFLWLNKSIDFSSNLVIVVMVFITYALIGFIDDFLKIKFKNNKGFKIISKLLVQTFISLIFFYIYMRNGGDPTLEISLLNININLGWVYGIFILFLLVGTSNAVNVTDGLDGLAGGLCAIAFLAFGLLSWNVGWLNGYDEIAIFCFVLLGSLLGFLVYNSHPAKVFMGDTGSMALGGSMAAIAILTKYEITLAVVGGVFVIEAISTISQIIAIRKFKRKIFKMAPLHHHFEQLGWAERDIVKMFYIVGFILAMAAITYGVWL